MKIVNIHGQPAWHEPARIVGTPSGLKALRDLIDAAILQGNAISPDGGDDVIFASDGEGYEIIVKCLPEDWGKPEWKGEKCEYTEYQELSE